MSRRRLLKITLPLLVLAGAVLVAGYLQATKPRIEIKYTELWNVHIQSEWS